MDVPGPSVGKKGSPLLVSEGGLAFIIRGEPGLYRALTGPPRGAGGARMGPTVRRGGGNSGEAQEESGHQGTFQPCVDTGVGQVEQDRD